MTSSVKQTVIRNPTWKRRTFIERGLTLLLVIAVIIGISLAITLAMVLYNNKFKSTQSSESVYTGEALHGSPPVCQQLNKEYPQKPGVCLTPGCIHTASGVLDAMDRYDRGSLLQ